MIDGPVRAWLQARREELNARFRRAQRRHPRLDGTRVLALMAELLPPLAGSEEGPGDELFASVYELILLHAARERMEAHGGALDLLLRETFPALRPLLLQRPRALCAAFSNAVENLGAQGLAFARRLPDVARAIRRADELLDAGALLAWRLGEARLREAALAAAAKLPPRAVLAALGLDGWPEASAPLVIDGLQADAWTAPAERFSAATLAQFPRLSGPQRDVLRKRLEVPAAPSAWRSAGTVGEFSGFGGDFEEPPVLVGSPDPASRHRFWARVGGRVFRLDADVYGWRCGRDADPAGTVRETADRRTDGAPRLRPDGRLEDKGSAVGVPGAEGAASYVLAAGLVAFTLPDSFRIRVAVPAGKAL